MVGATKVSNIYWMCLETCYLKETVSAIKLYEGFGDVDHTIKELMSL
jgi:hypothetical protein